MEGRPWLQLALALSAPARVRVIRLLLLAPGYPFVMAGPWHEDYLAGSTEGRARASEKRR